jgi:hypothetical protein
MDRGVNLEEGPVLKTGSKRSPGTLGPRFEGCLYWGPNVLGSIGLKPGAFFECPRFRVCLTWDFTNLGLFQ